MLHSTPTPHARRRPGGGVVLRFALAMTLETPTLFSARGGLVGDIRSSMSQPPTPGQFSPLRATMPVTINGEGILSTLPPPPPPNYRILEIETEFDEV